MNFQRPQAKRFRPHMGTPAQLAPHRRHRECCVLPIGHQHSSPVTLFPIGTHHQGTHSNDIGRLPADCLCHSHHPPTRQLLSDARSRHASDNLQAAKDGSPGRRQKKAADPRGKPASFSLPSQTVRSSVRTTCIACVSPSVLSIPLSRENTTTTLQTQPISITKIYPDCQHPQFSAASLNYLQPLCTNESSKEKKKIQIFFTSGSKSPLTCEQDQNQ
jgi:hypothetical protein